MSIRINTNTLSITAQRNLSTTAKAFTRSLQRLASGSRINRAGDDAAGLAIGAGLESQRRGILQAIRNMNDAKGFLNTAEGALAVQVDIVQRMRELALQAANGVLGSTERNYLDTEFQELVAEYRRITQQTAFNGVKLLDGSFADLSIQVGSRASDTIDLSVNRTDIEDSISEDVITNEFELVGNFFAKNPKVVQVGDIDEDGYLDYVAAQGFGSDRIDISFTDGKGNKTSGATLFTTGASRNARLADLDGDGHLDIVSAGDTAADGFNIFYGRGDGTFEPVSTLSIGVAIEGQLVQDVDQDGNLDLFAASGDTDYVLLGDGTGSFDAPLTFDRGFTATRETRFVDWNEDGNIDVLMAHDGEGVSLRLGNGDGTFEAPSTISSIEAIRLDVGDVNGDGHKDLATLDNDMDLRVSINDGSDGFTDTIIFSDNGSTFVGQAQFADLDLDGDLDLISSMNNIGVLLYENDGTGAFDFKDQLIAPDDTPHPGVIIDVNGDGAPDMVHGSDSSNDEIYTFFNSIETQIRDVPLHIQDQEQAKEILGLLDTTLNNLLESRSRIGAQLNRLDAATRNASITFENISLAKSQILDTDIAAETSELVRAQILKQAGVSVLAQANTKAQIALALLSF